MTPKLPRGPRRPRGRPMRKKRRRGPPGSIEEMKRRWRESDCYAKVLLRKQLRLQSTPDVPVNLVGLKREQLKLKRKLWNR